VQWQQLFHQFSPVPATAPAPRTKLPTSFSLLLTPGIPFGTPVPRRGRWHLGCLFAYYPVCLCYLSVCSTRHSHPSPVVVPSYFHSRTEFASRLPINVLWLSGRGLAQSPRCPSFIKYFNFHGSCNCRGIRRNLEHSLQIEHWQFYLWSLRCSGSTWLSKINLNPLGGGGCTRIWIGHYVIGAIGCLIYAIWSGFCCYYLSVAVFAWLGFISCLFNLIFTVWTPVTRNGSHKSTTKSVALCLPGNKDQIVSDTIPR